MINPDTIPMPHRAQHRRDPHRDLPHPEMEQPMTTTAMFVAECACGASLATETPSILIHELQGAHTAVPSTWMEPAQPTAVPATAPRIRVEREYLGYFWVVLYGYGPHDICQHLTWRGAITCALERARLRAVGMVGRW